jgi:hypothetical protein
MRTLPSCVRLLLTALLLPTAMVAQTAGRPVVSSTAARVRPDPMPAPHPERLAQGAQIFQRSRANASRPVASQFDSLGIMPMANVGDSVTLYYFDNGATLGRARTARVVARRRFEPPLSWRAACDNIAHPGWLYDLDAPPTSSFAVVLPGSFGMPVRRYPPPLAHSGSKVSFMAFADSAWKRYHPSMKPATDRAYAFLWYNFYTDSLDAGHGKRTLLGVRGPNGQNLAVFSFWLRDDYKDGTPNTTGTWLVDGWGFPVARMAGNVDIYGTVDSNNDGIDEVVTSGGTIRWDGTRWLMPTIYSDEPCLARRVMTPPSGVRP